MIDDNIHWHFSFVKWFRGSSNTFTDINECLGDVCKPTEMCLNTKGSYECFGQVCDVGFENVNGRCVGKFICVTSYVL